MTNSFELEWSLSFVVSNLAAPSGKLTRCEAGSIPFGDSDMCARNDLCRFFIRTVWKHGYFSPSGLNMIVGVDTAQSTGVMASACWYQLQLQVPATATVVGPKSI